MIDYNALQLLMKGFKRAVDLSKAISYMSNIDRPLGNSSKDCIIPTCKVLSCIPIADFGHPFPVHLQPPMLFKQLTSTTQPIERGTHIHMDPVEILNTHRTLFRAVHCRVCEP